MMRKTSLLGVMSFLMCALLPETTRAMAIINGSFDEDLAAWQDASNNGAVEYDIVRRAALLSSAPGSSVNAAVLIQGDDGSFSFGDAQTLALGNDWLTFDADFSMLGFDQQESGDGLADSFQVLMYDANDASGASDVRLLSILIEDYLGLKHFSLDVSPFTGRRVALSFELNDENDGRDHSIRLDNIRLQTRINSVPLPNSVYLIVSGVLAQWLGVGCCRSRRPALRGAAL